MALLITYWGLICALTHWPKLRPPGPPVGDKLAHFGGFAALASLLYAYLALLRPGNRWTTLIVLAMAMGYGIIDELTQPFFGRTCDFSDWTADCAGACVAVVLLGLVHWGIELVRRARPPVVTTEPAMDCRPDGATE